MKRIIIIVSAILLLVASIAAVIIISHSKPEPIGQLSSIDEQKIRDEIRKKTKEQILEIIPRDTVVIVNTGTNGVCWHCYYLIRTPGGWTISWSGT